MEIPSHWRLKDQRYRLIGDVCNSCDSLMFPPRPVCPGCGQLMHKESPIVNNQGDVFDSTEIKGDQKVNFSSPMAASTSSK